MPDHNQNQHGTHPRLLVAVVASVAYLALAGLLTSRSSSEAKTYFPKQTTKESPGISPFENEWYSKHLARMKEPVLSGMARDTQTCIYRLTILPTWGNPIAYRIEKKGQTYTLEARRLDGEGGYEPGNLVEQVSHKLSAADSSTVESLLAAVKFFALPVDDGIMFTDGDQWIWEGVQNDKYHVIQRQAPTLSEPNERNLAALLAFSKFLIDKSALSQRPQNRGYELLPVQKVTR